MRVARLSSQEVWRLGEDFVEAGRNHSKKTGEKLDRIKARADFVAAQIPKDPPNAVNIQPAPEDHPRHAVLVGWPSDKDAQAQIAAELALRANLVRREAV